MYASVILVADRFAPWWKDWLKKIEYYDLVEGFELFFYSKGMIPLAMGAV